MASLFQNNRMSPFSHRQQLEHKYTAARSNLLLVVVFTVINVILLAAKSNIYFLFAASIPYMVTEFGMLLCKMYPDSVYLDELGYTAQELEEQLFLPNSAFYIFLAVAFVLITLYFLCWLFSKQHRVGWLIFALVFFALDTLIGLFLMGISIDSIFDILFHAWVLYYLITGIRAHFKLKKLPAEDPSDPTEPTDQNSYQ